MVSLQDDYEKAMDVLADLAQEYEKWVQADLHRLQAIFKQAEALDGEKRTHLIQTDLFRVAHDMKGQGATFDYELVTQIGNHLCRYVEKKSFFGPAEMDAVSQHIQALAFVIDAHLTGDGGVEGQKLAAQIEDIT